MLSVVHRFEIGPDPADCRYRNRIVDSRSRQHAVAASGGGGMVGSNGGDKSVGEGSDSSGDGDGGDGGGGGADSNFNDMLEGLEVANKSGSPDPFKTKLQRFTALFQRSRTPAASGACDNCIDNLCFFGGDLYIMSDIAHMIKVQSESLDTLGQVDMEELLPVKMTCAHPQIDSDGVIWNVGTSHDPKKGYSYCVVKFEKTNPLWSSTMILENAAVMGSFPARHKHSPAFFHSFGMTRDFIIFIEQPLYLSDEDCRNGVGGAGAGRQNLKWKKTEMVHICLVNKRTGQQWPTVYTCEPFFFFHIINAHQTDQGGGYVVVDVVAYKDAEILSDLKFSHIERTDHVPNARPIRISLPLRSGTGKVVVRKEPLVQDASMELPRINYNFAGREYHYFYALGNEYLHPNKILKVEVSSGDVTSWKDPGHFVSEPVFVPRPPGGTPISVSRRGSYTSSVGGLDLGQQQQLMLQQRRRSSGAIGTLNLGLIAQKQQQLQQQQQQQQDEEEEKEVEDDGVLVFTLLSAASLQLVQLVVLDASDLAEVARVTYHATGTVTQSLHGVFLADSQADDAGGQWRY